MLSKPTFCCENQKDIIFPYDILCTCAVLWKIEQFISQEHANKNLDFGYLENCYYAL